MKDYPYERYLRDARILPIFEVCVFWLRSHGPFILSKQTIGGARLSFITTDRKSVVQGKSVDLGGRRIIKKKKKKKKKEKKIMT